MDVVQKARPSRVLTSLGGATVSGTDDVRVRLIGGLPAPGIDDLKRPFRSQKRTPNRQHFHPPWRAQLMIG
jgi:hypothetical protein